MLDIQSRIQNARVPVTIITISGDIDSSNFQTFQAYVDDQLAKGMQYALFNFQDLKRISSAGLRVIHTLFNKLRELHQDVNDDELRRKMSAGEYKSPYLKLTNLIPHVIDVFRLGGFDIYLEFFEDENTALHSF
ncbi:MAG: STAS domain-containing protein [Chloroflexi bacterium]|nr:STAS domain-containing protein [Chloroflexota bacterium]